MALVICPECQERVSSQAPHCPKCGYPINDSTPPRTIVVEKGSGGAWVLSGCLLVVLVVGGLLALGLGLPFIQKVREANARVAEEQRVLGKWKQLDGALSLEFFSDGTLREERPLNKGKGTYKLLPGRRMDLKIEGVLWGHNEVTVRYEITGDELVLTPDSGAGLALQYRRVK